MQVSNVKIRGKKREKKKGDISFLYLICEMNKKISLLNILCSLLLHLQIGLNVPIIIIKKEFQNLLTFNSE